MISDLVSGYFFFPSIVSYYRLVHVDRNAVVVIVQHGIIVSYSGFASM